jgi:radical SAM protein with 4Fe4S-binding SPASM domain
MSDGPLSRFRDGNALLRALSTRAGVPTGVHLQVADRCNHACQHCYQVQGQKGELSLDEVRGVIDDLAAQGVLTLNVSGGEATLRHDLVDILLHARSRGFAVRLYTNAFLIDEALADRLAAVGLHEVHVSLYAGTARDHDLVTRVPGSFARTVDGVRALRARGVRVVLKCPATSLTPDGARGVEALANELGCALRKSGMLTPREDGSLLPLEVAASPASLVAAGLLTPWRPEGSAADRADHLASGSCGVGRGGVVVLPNGDVLPCTDTPLRLGNALDDGLAKVLHSSAIAIFKELTRAHVHGCRDCDLVTACQRCHATALYEGGDYLGPYASACGYARARYQAAVGAVEVLPPASGCEPLRDVQVGPYRIEREGQLRPIPDVRTAEDEARVMQHPWIRSAPTPRSESSILPASKLVRPRAREQSGDSGSQR